MKLHHYFSLLLDRYDPLLVTPLKKAVALTFDDGPDPKHTPKLLTLLAKHGVKATFFLVGQQAEKYPLLTQQISDEGHTVGNHSWSHSFSLLQSKARMRYEIEKTQAVLENITGVSPRWYRPPFGVFGCGVEALLQEKGMRAALWTQSLGDWRPQTQRKLERYFERGLKKSPAIYLMHDGSLKASYCDRSQTIQLLESKIPDCLNNGTQFVTFNGFL